MIENKLVYTPEELGLEKIYDHEYFIHMQIYKDINNFYEGRYLISNYCRIFNIKNNALANIRKGKGVNVITVYNNEGHHDTLSLLRLMVYNFDRKNYNVNYPRRNNYYILDTSKPITLDNISDVDPKRTVLNEDHIKSVELGIQKGMTIEDIITEYDLPRKAAFRYFHHLGYKASGKKKTKIFLKDISIRFEEACNKISKEELASKNLSDIVRDICKEIGHPYSKTLYDKCRSYINGFSNNINIYRYEFND